MNASAGEIRKRYIATQLRRYWARGEHAVLRLEVPPSAPRESELFPPRLATVALPEWASDVAVAGGLLVAEQFVVPGSEEPWRRVDWWAASYWYLCGVAEQRHEHANGPIHSYSLRLGGWDPRMWERAWVNRIALFLRRWAAREMRQDERDLFGPVPAAEILVTHDVDAIRKTTAIRLKQSAFNALNALRFAARGKPEAALANLGSAVRFFFSSPDYWHFEEIQEAEEQAQLKSCFYVYGGDPRRRSLKQALLDPAYSAGEPRLAEKLRHLAANGWQVGLHQSFDAWRDSARMAEERSRVERATRTRITMCRQHWLRFSWRETWKAQQAAGLETDATLGFNDRPGFRNGASLRFQPWDEDAGAPLRLASLPMVLMDSHLYDYSELPLPQPQAAIEPWLNEVRAVRGSATVIWHQHTLGADYGWRPGFDRVIELAARSREP
jgi:hypothetical protein